MFRFVRTLIVTVFLGGLGYFIYDRLIVNPLQMNDPHTAEAVVAYHTSEVVVKNPESLLVLVNKKNTLEDDFEPSELVVPNVPFGNGATEEEKYLRSKAAGALEALFQEASQHGHHLIATSGYRSFELQEKLYQDFVNQMGLEAAEYRAAQPGNSEHQTGLAMDITSSNFNYAEYNNFGETPGGQWVAENAHHFGFIIRYPEGKEHITGYQYEPWHLRYIGTEQATYIYQNNLTFEEYKGEV